MKMKILIATIYFSIALALYDWFTFTDFSMEAHYYIKHFNHLASLIGFILMFYLFVFSSKLPIIEKNVGLDNMLKIHKKIGVGAITLLTMHPILLFVFEFIEFQSIRMMWARWIGLVVLIIIIGTSITAMNYKKINMSYESWRYIHYVNYLAFPLVLVHVFFNASSDSFSYYLWIIYGACFFVLLISKIYNIYKLRKNPYTLVNIKEENESITTLEFEGKEIDYLPGQFLSIQFKNRHNILQSHPFTISSSPTFNNISITAKELGDFTSELKSMKIGEKAYIDAPYGIFSHTLYENKNLVFIAGGVGITPFISMLRYMKDQEDTSNNVLMFWGNKSESDLVFRQELEMYEKELNNFKMVLVMSRQEDWTGEMGHINRDLILKYIDHPEIYTFFICGPPPLRQETKENLKKMGIRDKNILYESFDL